MAIVYFIVFLIAFPETGRNIVGNGSIPPQSWNMSLLNYLKARKAVQIANANGPLERTVSRDEIRRAQAELASKRKLRWPNPLRTIHIIFEKDVGILLFFTSIMFTAFYCITAAIPSLFAKIYGFDDLKIGLSFLPFGVGCACAAFTQGRLLDWNFRRVARKEGFPIDLKRGNDLRNFPIERARLQVAYPFIYLNSVVILIYGWILQIEAPLAAPLVLLFFIGFCSTGTFNVMSCFLVDLYPQSPSTATAANNLCRCLLGAGGTSAIIPMVNAMGRGWAFTLIAAIPFVLSPLMLLMQNKGPKWREARRVRMEEEKRVKDEKQAAKAAVAAEAEVDADAETENHSTNEKV